MSVDLKLIAEMQKRNVTIPYPHHTTEIQIRKMSVLLQKPSYETALKYWHHLTKLTDIHYAVIGLYKAIL